MADAGIDVRSGVANPLRGGAAGPIRSARPSRRILDKQLALACRALGRRRRGTGGEPDINLTLARQRTESSFCRHTFAVAGTGGLGGQGCGVEDREWPGKLAGGDAVY
jgi:hypothetical protein